MIALARSWCGYGPIIDAFKAKYGPGSVIGDVTQAGYLGPWLWKAAVEKAGGSITLIVKKVLALPGQALSLVSKIIRGALIVGCVVLALFLALKGHQIWREWNSRPTGGEYERVPTQPPPAKATGDGGAVELTPVRA